MITLKYTADLNKLKLSDQEIKDFAKPEFEHHKFVFEQMLYQGSNTKYPQGFGGKQQRIFGRILDKLDETKTDSIELENAEFDLINELLNDESSRFVGANTRIVIQYRNAIEAAKNANKE